jgi:hypothetical protein
MYIERKTKKVCVGVGAGEREILRKKEVGCVRDECVCTCEVV